VSQAAEKQAAQEQVGRTLGGTYTLTRVLGVGGMGAVYEGVHGATGKRIAVKLLAPHLSKDLKLVTRFRREAVAASRLVHENCVHVHDFGEDVDGTFFIAMELIDGRGLADELRASGPMAPERVARIGVQLLSALDAAHTAGVLHRDLKPQNVMLMQKPNRPDIVKVVDFGIAKITMNEPGEQLALTVPGTIFGTPEYMSPEQARGDSLDARSDIYSAAVVLWHLLLGRSPFRGTSVRETLLKVFSEEAPSPSRVGYAGTTASGLEHVLRTALAKNRDDRWQDAASFAAALAPFAGDGARPPTRAQPGLPRDGSAPPETLDAIPAPLSSSSSSSSVGARAHAGAAAMPAATVPLLEAVAPASPVPAPASPVRAVAANQESNSFPATRYGPSPSPPAPEPEPPPRLTTPPKATKVVTLDAVKRQTSGIVSAEPPSQARPPRRPRRMSVAALVVVACGVAVLVGFAVLAVAVLRAPPSSPATTTAASTPVLATTSTTPPAVVDPAVAQALAGVVVVDPLARDAALGRAQRALAEGRAADARREFIAAVVADPTAPAALAGLGTQAMQQRDWATASAVFGRLIELDASYRRQFGPMYARAKKLSGAAP
jgi:serine/threonine protein kinase